MNDLLHNKAWQQQLDNEGYVVIPFLGEPQVNELKKLYEQYVPQKVEAFFSTSFLEDAELKKKLNDGVNQIISNDVNALCSNYKSLGSSFLSKPMGQKGKMPVHQDWTIVNEPEFASVTIWVALQDTSALNGAITVLPRSHQFTDALRGPTLPFVFADYNEDLLLHMKTLNMKAGEAFVFNHALWHASHNNETPVERLALTYGLVHTKAALCFYHQNENKSVEKYAVDEQFFQNYNTQIGKKPKDAQLIDTFEYVLPKLSWLECMKKLNESYTMKPLFKDKEIEASLQKNGFVTIPVLDAAAVAELKNYYESLNLKDELGYGFHISMDQDNKDMVAEAMKKIYDVALPKIEPLMDNAKAFTCSYVVKEPNPQGVVPAHQDWSFIENEQEHYSVTVWIPLVDVTMENGALGAIKGSHKFSTYKRPSPSPEVANPLGDAMFSIFPYLDVIELKAGEAFVFMNNTFHASPPNTTDHTRLAVGIGFTQNDAKLRHYYLKPNGKEDTVMEYEIDSDFFYKYDNMSLSKMYREGKMIEGYKLLGEQPYQAPKYDTDELVTQIKAEGNVINGPLIEKLAKLFNYNMDGSKSASVEQSEKERVEQSKNDAWENRPIWVKYSPLNILREIKLRITGK